ncbi:MAG: cytochrome P450 [Novosphingobium sp.]|nr:cytochrome P450 [Novosphingobium sp.]
MNLTAAPHVPDHVDPALVVDWDYQRDEKLSQDPYARYAEWIAAAPAEVVWTTANGGHWMIMRNAAIVDALQSPELFSSKHTAIPPRAGSIKLIPEELDPPEHTKYRSILNRRLGPKMMKFFDARTRHLANALIDAVQTDREADLMDALTIPMPCSLFLEMVGLSTDRTREFVGWKDELFKGGDAERAAAQAKIVGMLEETIADKRVNPGEFDLMSFLIHEGRVDDKPISQEDLMSYGFLFFIAGLDTVTSLMTSCFAYIAQRPGTQERLLAEPRSIPDFVEEMLRRYSVVNPVRTATQDFNWRGVRVRKDDQFVCSTVIADLDPAEFSDPLKVDVERAENRHLGFGGGPHRCVGSHLARTELMATLQEVLPRLPNLRIKPGAQLTYTPGSLLGLASLPVAWDD